MKLVSFMHPKFTLAWVLDVSVYLLLVSCDLQCRVLMYCVGVAGYFGSGVGL